MKIIINGRIVRPQAIEDKKALLIKDGKILGVCLQDNISLDNDKFEIIDAEGNYIIPGLIDCHCDALEFKFHPRPNVDIPPDFALSCYEKELLSCGITTQFHGIYWGEVLEKDRTVKVAKEMIKNILNYRKTSVLNHKIFIRFDISKCEAKDELMQLIEEGKVNLISFQYHLPGQAQFKNLKAFKDYYTKVRGWKEEELEKFIKDSPKFVLKNKIPVLKEVSSLTNKFKVPIASHDDDNKQKIYLMKNLGVRISEFPTNLEAAFFAKQNNMYVVVGGPNVIQGKSSCGNISALDLIKQKVTDIICSDYYPPSMLLSSIKLWRQEILSLPEAINMITLNPAEATGLSNKGAISAGKEADIVVFRLKDDSPEVIKVLVGGRMVYSYEVS
ncbi:alpha-D-ribose 1-methylphosphonate 5-triphosphate diphosphatase [candidate division NPL-UPA2 bacterium]|nr:alpha-D-ribose 1-methylphosphonate 5-triphosphate diphosphatase [candidate division NPL-UPA2 bacterium]